MRSHMVLIVLMLGLLLLLVDACNNRPRPFRDRMDQFRERREYRFKDQEQGQDVPDQESRRRRFRFLQVEMQ